MDKSKKKRVFIGGAVIIGIIITVYLIVSMFFCFHYYPDTMIGDIDCSGKTASQVEKIVEERTKNYVLTIKGREETESTLSSAEIGMEFIFDDTLQKIMKDQNSFLWLFEIWKEKNHDMPITVKYEEDALEKRCSEMVLFQDKNMRSPTNAVVGEYDRDKKEYPIIEEDEGTRLAKAKAKKAIMEAINNLQKELDLDEADCYVHPEICSDNKDLIRFGKQLNRYVSARIVYDWNGREIIVDGNLINEWLDVDRKNNIVTIIGEDVRNYITEMSREYDTFGKDRVFVTTKGHEVSFKNKNYGWRVDREKEAQNLMMLIRMGRQTKREPEYLYTAAAKGENDIGDSYVEINLTDQHLYLYIDGEIVTESDFVSGNEARNFSTPDGVYGITYKTLDATLKGQGYSTPVKYWMPFNGNIGLHDAKWRREFGGKIYKTNGSHGCINLPKDKAEEIYGYVEKGFPVVCYRDEAGDEKETESDAVIEEENMENEETEYVDEEEIINEEEGEEQAED